MFVKTRHLIGLLLAAGDHLLSATICIFAGWEVSCRCSRAQRKPKLGGFQAETFSQRCRATNLCYSIYEFNDASRHTQVRMEDGNFSRFSDQNNYHRDCVDFATEQQ